MELWSLLEDAARAHPGAVAAREGGCTWTWSRLHAEVAALAAGLGARGVRPGDRVAVLDDNGVAYLQAYFALAGLGAIAVPLNRRLADRELAAILEDASPRAWLATSDASATVTRLAAEVPGLELLVGLGPEPLAGGPALADLIAEASPFEPYDASPEDPAQLYYTSGTTGRPKGVVLTHANVLAHAQAAQTELDLYQDDVWAHVAPMFHLADAWAVWAITLAGGTHAFVRRFTPDAALGCLREDGVTLTNLVPTMLQALLADLDGAGAETPALRLILSGGAPIAPAVVGRTLATFGCEYAQTYGLTETSPFLTLSLLRPHHHGLSASDQLAERARTGRPYETIDLQVVDEDGRPVPQDDHTVGEIRVRGTTVSPGYWNRPEETAAVFRDGWFHTGDLATWNEESSVNIVDRAKDVILTGGENVYSTEVEAALLEHAAVQECAAYGVPHPRWGEELRVAVLLAPGAEASGDDLRAHCRERLANYKVPKRVELVDELPRTGSGKVRKNVLRERAAASPEPR